MLTPRPGQVRDDVAAASAAYMVQILPELMTLSKPDLFEALRLHFRTSILAYEQEKRRRAAEASRN